MCIHPFFPKNFCGLRLSWRFLLLSTKQQATSLDSFVCSSIRISFPIFVRYSCKLSYCSSNYFYIYIYFFILFWRYNGLGTGYYMTEIHELAVNGICDGRAAPTGCSGLAIVSRFPFNEVNLSYMLSKIFYSG